MYTLSRKVIIRKWEPGRNIDPFSLYRHGEEAAGSAGPKEMQSA